MGDVSLDLRCLDVLFVELFERARPIRDLNFRSLTQLQSIRERVLERVEKVGAAHFADFSLKIPGK